MRPPLLARALACLIALPLLTVGPVAIAAPFEDAKAAFERAHARCLGVELAREWGNRPGNHATPTHLAKVAQELAQHKRISCEVLGPREVAKLGMGSFSAVAPMKPWVTTVPDPSRAGTTVDRTCANV